MKTIMKITLLFTFAFYLLPFSFLFGQDTWVKTYRPFQQPYMEDKYFVEDVIVTQDSGYVVSGSYELYDEFYYEHWGFLMKTDKDGNVLWASKDSVDFMSDNGDFVDFVETSDGDFLTIGSRIPSGGYMIKRDNEGNRIWAIPYTSFGTKSMFNTADNNIILGGVVNSNIALRKIDNNGNTLWTKSYNCGNVAIANSIKETSEGDYILTGIVSGNGYDIIVMKTDSLGDSLWTRTFDGYGGYDQGNSIIDTDEDNIIIIGEIGSRSIDTFVGYYNNNGDVIWEYIIYHMAAGISVLQSSDRNFVAYSWGGASTQQTHLFKFNSSFNEIWNRQFDFYPSNGDRCFRELKDGSFICGGRTHYHNDNFYIAKTDSLGQVYSIDETTNHNNNISINILPNPVLDNCKIILNNCKVSLKDPNIIIYNIKGQKVKELEIENVELGMNEIIWDGTSFDGKEVHNGIYFLKLEGDNYRAVKKVTKIE